MLIRTQVSCFVLFLAILPTASLLHSEMDSAEPSPAAPPRVSDPEPFYAAVSQHFQVLPRQVHDLVEGGLPPSQVVVLYYISKHSLRLPTKILADRKAGKSWQEIALASGVEPETFYYPESSHYPESSQYPMAYSRAPFVNVYALYHQQPRNRWTWDRLQLPDADIENLVNLRFLAELGGHSVPDIMRLRSQGHDFVSIHHFLLSGQKTAQRQVAAAGNVRS